MFRVMCRVSGGVTGTREGLMKKNGVELVFKTRAEAQEAATRATKDFQGNPYRVADFRYWVVEEL